MAAWLEKKRAIPKFFYFPSFRNDSSLALFPVSLGKGQINPHDPNHHDQDPNDHPGRIIRSDPEGDQAAYKQPDNVHE
jgi:hypothetical protein